MEKKNIPPPSQIFFLLKGPCYYIYFFFLSFSLFCYFSHLFVVKFTILHCCIFFLLCTTRVKLIIIKVKNFFKLKITFILLHSSFKFVSSLPSSSKNFFTFSSLYCIIFLSNEKIWSC